jgi:hypothetical protein
MENWGDINRLDTLAKQLSTNPCARHEIWASSGAVADMLESLSGSLQSNSSEPATQLGHIIHVINAAQQAGVVVGRRSQTTTRGWPWFFDSRIISTTGINIAQ